MVAKYGSTCWATCPIDQAGPALPCLVRPLPAVGRLTRLPWDADGNDQRKSTVDVITRQNRLFCHDLGCHDQHRHQHLVADGCRPPLGFYVRLDDEIEFHVGWQQRATADDSKLSTSDREGGGEKESFYCMRRAELSRISAGVYVVTL